MTDLNTLISAHWNAKNALDAAQTAEKEARIALATFLSENAESFSNKTVDLAGGWKLRQEVQRKLNVAKSHEDYSKLPTLLGSADTLNSVLRPKHTLEPSMTGYKNLPEDVKAKVAHLFTVTETVAIKYDPPKDNR